MPNPAWRDQSRPNQQKTAPFDTTRELFMRLQDKEHGRASNKESDTGRVERTRRDFAHSAEQRRNQNSADADRIPLGSAVGQPLPDNTKPPNTSYTRECSGAYMEHETGFEPATLTLAT